ncbi:MAG: M3 family metallopeptidase [Pseudomonadota bacterium]
MTSGNQTNPLLKQWDTPFGLPPFSSIATDDYTVAFDEALAAHRAEIDAIAGAQDDPTFENTILALERAGEVLTRVGTTFWVLSGANTNPDMQVLEREFAPKVTAHMNAVTSNKALFTRIDAVNGAADTLNLDAEQRQLLKRTHRSFVRAGAQLDEDNKQKLNEITERLSELGTQFSQNVLADENDYQLALNTPADLEGLPPFLVDAAAAAAKERGADASHVITLSRSLIEPFLTFSPHRHLREQAYKAWAARGQKGGDTDNREIISETLRLRQERARVLGFTDFAAFKLDNTMAKTPAAVDDLLSTVWKPAVAAANAECARLTEAASSEGQNIDIEPWDWRYYAEKVRQTDYALDETEIKAYLPLDQVITAAFDTATRLFGISFEEQQGLDLYHPDVRAWRVSNSDGQDIALFVGDYFARSSKRSGAWMTAFRGQRRYPDTRQPIILNVMNFAKAEAGRPTLLSFDDARTLFHEFGHGLHGLLSDVTYGSLSGTSVERDFVELPSQLYEHWLEADEVLSKFARHHETGEAMPQELIAKIKAAQNFNQGFATVEYLASALVDMAFHSPKYDSNADPIAFQDKVLSDLGLPRAIKMRHQSPHFQHVFSGDGYSAGYYSYMWSEVLDADAFTAFEETGDVFDPGTAEKLKTFIYSAGGQRDGDEAYLAFRGKMPTPEGLLRQRGLIEGAAAE